MSGCIRVTQTMNKVLDFLQFLRAGNVHFYLMAFDQYNYDSILNSRSYILSSRCIIAWSGNRFSGSGRQQSVINSA
jgi:hypothetical protein